MTTESITHIRYSSGNPQNKTLALILYQMILNPGDYSPFFELTLFPPLFLQTEFFLASVKAIGLLKLCIKNDALFFFF